MKQPEGRYAVCDEARRAPNNSALLAGTHVAVQHWGEDGESARYDDLSEAKGFANTLWESEGRHHLVVIKDKAEGDKIIHAFEIEPRDTQLREPDPDETRRIPVVPKDH